MRGFGVTSNSTPSWSRNRQAPLSAPAVPTVVPAGETYTLLQRKGVDAVEWAPPSGNLPEGFHEAAKYIVIPGVHQPTFLWEVVTTQETWDALPEDLKPLIEAAAKLTTYEGLTHFYHADREAMKEYRAGPNEIITLDDASLQSWAMRDATGRARRRKRRSRRVSRAWRKSSMAISPIATPGSLRATIWFPNSQF